MSSGPVFQNSTYVGINLEDILYGVELVLYFNTLHALLFHGGQRRSSDVFYAVFSTVMLMMVTIFVSTQAVFGEMMWLVNANYPGGPNAYWANNSSTWYMDFGSTAVVILQLMTDGLMIYRCYTLWASYRVVIIPAVLWVGTLVLSILVLWTSSSPGGNFFAGIAAELGIAYYSVSVGLTVMMTSMICYQIMSQGWRVKQRLGYDYASAYFDVLALVVESVLPYPLSGIAFLVSFGVGSNTSIAFSNVYIMMMCISPQMLILRVASGKGSRRAMKEETSEVLPATEDSKSVWLKSRRFKEGGGSVGVDTYQSGKQELV